MRKTIRKATSPVKLKSEIVFHYKNSFIFYINELAPEVARDLKKLTAKCQEFFGKMPAAETDLEKRRNYFSVCEIVYECFWKIDGHYCGTTNWTSVIKRYDGIHKPFLDSWFNLLNENGKVVDSEIGKNPDYWKTLYSEAFQIPEQEIKGVDLRFQIGIDFNRKLYETNEKFQQMRDTQDKILNEFEDFQKSFADLLEKHQLEKDWLASIVFQAIWDGTGQLQYYSSYGENLPSELIEDIKKKLEEEKPFWKKKDFWEKEDSNEITGLIPTGIALQNLIPHPDAFQYQESLSLFFSFEEYEEKAIEAYRQHLKRYFTIIHQSLKEHGYKSGRGKPHDYTRVKWLVWWNVKKWCKDKILDELAKDEIYLDLSTIDKAFRKFKHYELPVRK